MGIVILLVIVATIVFLTLAFRLLRVEYTESQQRHPDGGELPEMPPEEGAFGGDAALWDSEYSELDPTLDTPFTGEEYKEQEQVDVFDYFEANQEIPASEEEVPDLQQEAQKTVEERDMSFDSLSEMKVGRGFVRECQRILGAAKEDGQIWAVACFDIDRFRFINSLKGYSIGDYVLTKLARELRMVFPDGSQYTRISCDRFAVLFPWTTDQAPEEYAEQLRRICDEIRDDMAIKSSLRISMGIAVPGEDEEWSYKTLLHRADLARHCLKTSKHESVGLYNDSIITSFLYGDSSLEDYGEVQFGDDFQVFYLPVSDIRKNQIIASEALLRWACEDGRREETPTGEDGRIPVNGYKVFYQVCRTVSRWRKQGKVVLPVYINLPATEFFKEDLDDFFSRCLSEYQMEPSLIRVVLDYSLLRLDWSIASRQIKRLRETGMHVGVGGVTRGEDDIAYLDGLNIQFIRLDRSFAAQLDEHGGELRQVMDKAVEWKCKVILDGVDTVEQMEAARGFGVQQVEGRYAGRSSAAEEFAQTLQEERMSQHGDTTVILEDSVAFGG